MILAPSYYLIKLYVAKTVTIESQNSVGSHSF